MDDDMDTEGAVQHTLGILHALSTDSGVISVVASNCLGSDTASTTLKVLAGSFSVALGHTRDKSMVSEV